MGGPESRPKSRLSKWPVGKGAGPSQPRAQSKVDVSLKASSSGGPGFGHVPASTQPRVLLHKESPSEPKESLGLSFVPESLSTVVGVVVGEQTTPTRHSDVVEATSDNTPPMQCTQNALVEFGN